MGTTDPRVDACMDRRDAPARMATALEWLSAGKSRNWQYERTGGAA